MMNRVLIQGPSWLGDMVMAQSLFRLIKQKNPDVLIDVLAPEWSLGVVSRMPEVNSAIVLPTKHGEFGFAKRLHLARKLRENNYQQAIILTNNWKSALIPYFAKIPIRTGWCGEFRFGLINDIRFLNKKLLTLMVQRYCALGIDKNEQLPEKLPYPKLVVPQEQLYNALNKFNLNTQKPILALCPGAAYGPAKRWPAEYFITVAKSRIDQGWQIWFFGSKQDDEIISNIQKQIFSPTISLAGKLNLLETIDLLSVTSAVVANDSGLLHSAAALNIPLVAIYGSTTPGFTPPLTDKLAVFKKDLACSPCFARECKYKHLNCLYMIKPEEVLRALSDLEHK